MPDCSALCPPSGRAVRLVRVPGCIHGWGAETGETGRFVRGEIVLREPSASRRTEVVDQVVALRCAGVRRRDDMVVKFSRARASS